jgi:O-antigen/teichoic acid export membrane protein
MFEELKKLLKQSAIYGIGNIVTPFISFVMLPVYARFLTPAEFGILALTAVVIAFLSTFITLGVNAGLMRFYFAYSEKKDKDEVVTSSILFSLLFSIVIIGILWLFLSPISTLVFDFEKGQLYFKLTLLTALVNTGIMDCLAVLRAEEKPVTYSVVTVLRLIFTLSLNIVFVVVLKRKVQGILEAGLISGTISYLATFVIAVRRKSLSISWAKIKRILAFGVPLVPGSIAALVLSLSDRYFLKHFATMNDVGLYAVGFRVAGVLNIAIVEPFRIAWPPYMFSAVEREDAKEIYRKVFVYFTFIAVWAGLFLSVFAREGLMLLATPAYYSAYRVVPLLVLSGVLLGMCAVLVAGIQISNNTKYASYSFLIAAAVSLGMNFLLVPKLGMIGAALASAVAYATLSVFYYTFSQRFYSIRYEFRRIVTILAVAFVLYGLCFVVTVGRSVAVSVVLKVVFLLLYPALLYLLGFFAKEEIRKIREILHVSEVGFPARKNG